jgi:hypothetical protein
VLTVARRGNTGWYCGCSHGFENMSLIFILLMFVIELGSGGQIQIHARKTSDRFQTSKSDPSEPLKSIEDFCPCL